MIVECRFSSNFLTSILDEVDHEALIKQELKSEGFKFDEDNDPMYPIFITRCPNNLDVIYQQTIPGEEDGV